MYQVLLQCFLIRRGWWWCWKNKSCISKLVTFIWVNVSIYVIVCILETACLVSSCLLVVVTEVEICPDLRVLP